MMRFIRRMFATVVFISVLLGGIYFLLRFFRKDFPGILPDSVYNYEEGSFDIMFIGPSTTHNGIYPMYVWEEFGFTSYDVSTASQTIPESYYLTEEMIRRFRPKVIAVDMGAADSPSRCPSVARLHNVTDSIPITSPVRWEMAWDLGGDEFLQSVFPLMIYHERWKDITGTEVLEEERYYRSLAFGAVIHAVQRTGTPYIDNPLPDNPELNTWPEYYLKKIIQICRETNTGLLFYTTPTFFRREYSQADYDARREAYAAIEVIAEKEGIPFLNYYSRYEDIGIDPEHDSSDGHHLNRWGAKKYSSLIGAYIRDYFKLADNRGKPEYQWMSDAYEHYRQVRWEKYLKGTNRLNIFFDMLQEAYEDDDLIVVMSMSGAAPKPLSASESRQILKSGSEQNLYHYGNYSYLAVLDNGRIVRESDVRSRALSEEVRLMVDGIPVEASSTVGSEGIFIRIGGEDMSPEGKGLYIIVYNKRTRKRMTALRVDMVTERHNFHYA